MLQEVIRTATRTSGASVASARSAPPPLRRPVARMPYANGGAQNGARRRARSRPVVHGLTSPICLRPVSMPLRPARPSPVGAAGDPPTGGHGGGGQVATAAARESDPALPALQRSRASGGGPGHPAARRRQRRAYRSLWATSENRQSPQRASSSGMPKNPARRSRSITCTEKGRTPVAPGEL